MNNTHNRRNIMIKETALRDWFGAVREIADEAAENTGIENASAFTRVKVNILLRRYLCKDLAERIMETDGTDKNTAEEMQKQINSEQMEDAAAGIWSENESAESAMFMYDCIYSLLDASDFISLLKRALKKEISDETALAVKELADRRMDEYCAVRKKPPVKYERNEDDPPEWLDEFEYIDWVITHR